MNYLGTSFVPNTQLLSCSCAINHLSPLIHANVMLLLLETFGSDVMECFIQNCLFDRICHILYIVKFGVVYWYYYFFF